MGKYYTTMGSSYFPLGTVICVMWSTSLKLLARVVDECIFIHSVGLIVCFIYILFYYFLIPFVSVCGCMILFVLMPLFEGGGGRCLRTMIWNMDNKNHAIHFGKICVSDRLSRQTMNFCPTSYLLWYIDQTEAEIIEALQPGLRVPQSTESRQRKLVLRVFSVSFALAENCESQCGIICPLGVIPSAA